MPRVAKPKVTPIANFKPISELDALIEADEAMEAAPPPKHDEDDKIGQAVAAEVDKEVAAMTPPLPPVPSVTAVTSAPTAPEPPAPPPCALDGETVNSKVVMIRVDGKKHAVLMTPRGEVLLALNDVAWHLPEGGKVSKAADGRFVAIQLDHNRHVAPLECATAREAIEKFHAHFHG